MPLDCGALAVVQLELQKALSCSLLSGLSFPTPNLHILPYILAKANQQQTPFCSSAPLTEEHVTSTSQRIVKGRMAGRSLYAHAPSHLPLLPPFSPEKKEQGGYIHTCMHARMQEGKRSTGRRSDPVYQRWRPLSGAEAVVWELMTPRCVGLSEYADAG